jgi:hypothetical protein
LPDADDGQVKNLYDPEIDKTNQQEKDNFETIHEETSIEDNARV